MKTHAFANYLELLAQHLRRLPNTELETMLQIDIQKALPGFDAAEKGSMRKARPLPLEIESKLQSMSPAEIEAYLSSEEEAFTVANLTELAERLGLTSSKRQSKSALVNMITRHFEAGKMHSIMRGARSDGV